MDIVTLVGLILGFIGAVAGGLAALWVYRRERSERAETAKRDAAAREARDQAAITARDRDRAADDARHARDVRRAKHQDDYRLVSAALESLLSAASQIEAGGYLTRSAAGAAGVGGLQEQLEKLAARLPALEFELFGAGHAAWEIESKLLPDSTSVELMSVARYCIRQELAIEAIRAAVKPARLALDKEWGA